MAKSGYKERKSLDGEPDFLRRAQRGEAKAFAPVVEHYRERLYMAALGLVRNHEDARDISQEAFVRAYGNLSRFDLGRPFYPWIYRILRNLCLDHLQKYGPSRSLSYDALVEESHVQFDTHDGHASARPVDPREKAYTEEMKAHLRREISRLKPEFREIIVMKHFEDYSYKEIAEALDIPIGTVMSRLYHARRALADRMRPHRD